MIAAQNDPDRRHDLVAVVVEAVRDGRLERDRVTRPEHVLLEPDGDAEAAREHDPELAAAAKEVSSRVRDLSALLLERGQPQMREAKCTVTYHDACHLAHGMGVREGPRKVLAAIPGVILIELNESDLCCGSAGRAYALLNLYKHTGLTEWLSHARRLANHAASVREEAQRPNSLWKGELGVAVLIADLESPENAQMPFFE